MRTSEAVRRVPKYDLSVEQTRWASPCPECGDFEVEKRVVGADSLLPAETVACLTCGLIRAHTVVAAPVNGDDGRTIREPRSSRNRERDQEMRELRRAGVSSVELARRYGVSATRVAQITGMVRASQARYSDDDLLDSLSSLKQDLGRWPFAQECKRPTKSTFEARFGSWSASLNAAKKREARRRAAPLPSRSSS